MVIMSSTKGLDLAVERHDCESGEEFLCVEVEEFDALYNIPYSILVNSTLD
jgi:hypothetical protein